MTVQLPAALLAAIHAAPDEPEAYLVAADWLQQQGERQGELIALSIAHDAAPDESVLGLLIDELHDTLDPVAQIDRTWVRDWRWGFLRRVVVSEPVERLHTLMPSPAAQCIRELEMRTYHTNVAAAIDAIIAHAPALRSLRSLVVPASPDKLMQPQWPVLPQLERLKIGIGELPGASVMPALRELEIEIDTSASWRSREPFRGVRDLVVRCNQLLADPTELLGPVPALQRITIIGAPGTVSASGLDALAAQIDEVDVITWGEQSPTMRRFRARQPRLGCRPAALLAVGGSKPVVPGTMYRLPDDRPFVLGRSVGVDLGRQGVRPEPPGQLRARTRALAGELSGPDRGRSRDRDQRHPVARW
ncbi:MAG: TIGR02996 domain-containing protein [Kofleriaceae bacterium]